MVGSSSGSTWPGACRGGCHRRSSRCGYGSSRGSTATRASRCPAPLVGVEHFKRVYSHPAANGRSRGAALSDLFWYWLAPGPRCTRSTWSRASGTTRSPGPRGGSSPCRRQRAEELAADASPGGCWTSCRRAGLAVRLRDLMMPIWAEFFYELVFGEAVPAAAAT